MFVPVPPGAVVSPSNITVTEVSGASLTCVGEGTDPLNITWSRLSWSSRPITAQVIASGRSSNLTFVSVSRNDSGIYQCSVTNYDLVDPDQRTATAQALITVQGSSPLSLALLYVTEHVLFGIHVPRLLCAQCHQASASTAQLFWEFSISS